MENKKKEYTGMKAVIIEFNKEDIIATSGEGCHATGIPFPGFNCNVTNEMSM